MEVSVSVTLMCNCLEQNRGFFKDLADKEKALKLMQTAVENVTVAVDTMTLEVTKAAEEIRRFGEVLRGKGLDKATAGKLKQVDKDGKKTAKAAPTKEMQSRVKEAGKAKEKAKQTEKAAAKVKSAAPSKETRSKIKQAAKAKDNVKQAASSKAAREKATQAGKNAASAKSAVKGLGGRLPDIIQDLAELFPQNEYIQGLYRFEEGYSNARKKGATTVSALVNSGSALFPDNEYITGMQKFEDAFSKAKKQGATTIGAVLSGGNSLFPDNEYIAGMQKFEDAFSKAKKQGATTIGAALSGGNSLFPDNEYITAMQKFEESFSKARKKGNSIISSMLEGGKVLAPEHTESINTLQNFEKGFSKSRGKGKGFGTSLLEGGKQAFPEYKGAFDAVGRFSKGFGKAQGQGKGLGQSALAGVKQMLPDNKLLTSLQKITKELGKGGSNKLFKGIISGAGEAMPWLTRLSGWMSGFTPAWLINAARIAAGWLVAMGPVGWIIAGVTAVIAAAVWAWNTNFMGFRDFAKDVFEKIKNFAMDTIKWVSDLIKKVKAFFGAAGEEGATSSSGEGNMPPENIINQKSITNNSATNIGHVTINTQSTDPRGIAGYFTDPKYFASRTA